jgi:RNA polymerase sigma-70 factor (ECF subfamily)
LGGTDAQKQFLQMPEQLSEVTDPMPGRGEAGELASRALDLIKAEFEDRTWQAFLRTTLHRQSPAEVAKELGITVAAVYQAKSRVMRRIRRELGDLFG